MTNDYHLRNSPTSRPARSRHDERKVAFVPDTHTPWRRVGEVSPSYKFTDHTHYSNVVKSILTRDKHFMAEVAKNKLPTYAVVELAHNLLTVKLISDAVVREPRNDLLTARGYDRNRFVVIKFDPVGKMVKTISLNDDNAFILDLYCNQVFDRMVSLKDLQIGTIDNSLRD